MKAVLRTFKAGKGDCVAFQIAVTGNVYNILIDCGVLTPAVKTLIDDEWKQHIHLLVVTHFDDDHIEGLIEMLGFYPDLVIDKIWYNCGQKVEGFRKPLNEKKKQVIERLRSQLPKIANPITHQITVESSLTLAEKILSKQSWMEAWMQEDYVTASMPNMPLPNDMGELIVLSPNEDAINALKQNYIEAFNVKFYTRYEGPYEGGETIFELMMRLTAKEREDSICQVGTKIFDLDFIQSNVPEGYISLSPSNKASIAFLWEKDEHRVLFLGDADPHIVYDNIRQKAIFSTIPQKLDAIKVSHHGSKHSTIMALQDLVDAEQYFFTGGDETNCRPSHESIARIITHSMPTGVEKRTLHFNYPTSIVKKYVDASEALKQSLHFDAINMEECRYEIEI